MNIYWAFPEQKWNAEPIPEGKDLDPNRAFLPLQLAKKALQGLGHVVLPINNRYRSQEVSHDDIVFSFDAMHVLPKDILRKHRVKRLVHFFMEALMVGMRYYSHKYQQDVFEKADTVFVQDPSYIHTRFRNSKKLKAFKFAHSHLGIEDSLFSHSSRKLLVLINANKGIGLKQSVKRLMLGVNPLSYYPNWLLRERMRWIHDLARKKEIDVYGYGWNRYSLELSHVSSPLENQAWKGTIEGPKFPVLAEYDFCLCFENSRFPGYVTEKIFDCFSTGTIPIYRGAPNINEYLPEGSFINLSDFNSGDELLHFLKTMDDSVKSSYRDKMKRYLNNHRDDPFSPLRMADLIVQEVEKA